MVNLKRNITLVLFSLFLFILFMTSILALELLPGEPETCGDGIIDSTETLYNCNKDVSPTIVDYYRCIDSGHEGCIYYKIYVKTLTMIFSICGSGFVVLYLLTNK